MTRLVWLACLILICSQRAFSSAPSDFEPIPESEKPLYHFDLQKWFYADQSAYQNDLGQLKSLSKDLAQLKGKVVTNANSLLSAIICQQKMGVLAGRLQAYNNLKYAVNTQDTAASEEGDKVDSEFDAATKFVKLEVQAASDSTIQAFLNQLPELGQSKYLISQWRRDRPYSLTEPEETLLSKLRDPLNPFDLAFYNLMVQRTSDATVVLNGQPINVTDLNQYSIILRSDNREQRQQGFQKRLAAYKNQADLYGYGLYRKIQSANSVAALHRFSTAIDESLFQSHIAPATVDAVLAEFVKHADLTMRFQKAEREYQRKLLKLKSVEPWDMEVRPPQLANPRFQIAQAADAVRGATAILGNEYGAELANLLDPKNGRLDIVSGPSRQSGAFTWGAYGPSWVFFMQGYQGYLTDVVMLAHESAHAVHFRLIFQNKVPWVYSSGAPYFTEGFAKVNELLLLNYLAKHATTADERLYYLKELSSKLASVKFASVYWAAIATSFEVQAYRRAAAGQLTKPDELHDIWAELGRQWTFEFDKYPDQRFAWAGTHHFFDAPRYYSNYLFAWVLAVSLYDKFDQDPTTVQKYVGLMKTGFIDDPDVLLKTHLGIDFTDPQILKGVFSSIDRSVTEFENQVHKMPE